MATYAIGDIQGCFDSLCSLLEYVRFDQRSDRVWLVGDLVNRGPKSLQVLRWVRDMGDRAVSVLGNHDIHLLLTWAGIRRIKKRDTLAKVLDAPDAPELIDWLRMQPVLHVENNMAMVHAGLHPAWSIADAQRMADEISGLLRAKDWHKRIDGLLSKKEPPVWSEDLPTSKRIRASASIFFTMRTCRPDGSLCDSDGPPGEAPIDCKPWFKFAKAPWRDHTVFFGHWSTLGLLQGKHVMGLDTGCVWGGALTAYRLDDDEIFQVPALESGYSGPNFTDI